MIVACYDCYRIIDDASLGAPPESAAQRIDAARARAALEEMRTLEVEQSDSQQVEHRGSQVPGILW